MLISSADTGRNRSSVLHVGNCMTKAPAIFWASLRALMVRMYTEPSVRYLLVEGVEARHLRARSATSIAYPQTP